MEPIALSITETGNALGGASTPLSRDTIERMMKRGELDGIKLGGRTLVTTASIKRFVDSAPRIGTNS